jgi:tetratricopeptide (TPR) repeat protein
MRLLALALLLAGPTAPDVAPAAMEALARGDARHAAFDYEAARREYEQALAVAPGELEARVRLAHVLNDLATERLATPQARRQGDAGRDARAPARALLEEALALADGIARDAPERPEGHYGRAESLAGLMPFYSGPEKVRASRQLAAAARQAFARDPCFTPAYTVLAITLRELAGLGGFVRSVAGAALGGLPEGSLADAVDLLRAAIVIDPGDPFPRYQLALTLEAQRRAAEAVPHLEEVLCLPEREARDRRNREDAARRLERLRAVRR